MKLNINLNEERGSNPDYLAKNWRIAEREISNIEDAREVFCNYSYSPHEWINGNRNDGNYLRSFFIVADYDSGMTINQAKQKFKEYQHIIVTSRTHQKVKETHIDIGKVDRFHVIFPLQNFITDKSVYSNLADASVFEGSDKLVFNSSRCFFASPDDAEIYLNSDGKLLKLEGLQYNKTSSSIINNNNNIKWHLPGEEGLEKIRANCRVVDHAFNSIENDQAGDTPGHHKRILAANMIKNTLRENDEEYALDLFSNTSDFDPEITLKQYHSIKGLPITCNKLQSPEWNHMCPGICQAMNTIGKKSPIAFAYQSQDSDRGKTENSNQINEATFRMLPVSERCNDWYRVGPYFNEVILLQDEGDVRLTRRANQDVLTRLGEDAPVYIIKEKSVADPVNYDFIGGEGRELSYEYRSDRFVAYSPLPAVDLKDNVYIDKFLADLFAEHVDFIKSWIAFYTYSNFLHLPILILTGPRGTGKSLFAEVVGMIYKNLFGRFDTSTNYTEHNGLKLAIIEEADEIDNRKLYSILKDVGGTEKLIKNVKYGPKSIVRNNLNIIVISNNRTPLYLKSKEFPTSEFNNQFFVFNLKPVNGSLNNRLKEEIGRRIGWWLRTEIKDLYEQLQNRNDSERFRCRYQIPVPITADELLLFENNTTESELAIQEFLDDLKTDYLLVSDLRSLSWKSGISEHQIKRKLVEMGVIESVGSLKDKRNLKGIDGATHSNQPRYYKLTSTYKQGVLYKKVIQE
jgi:uncharacterized protein DUF5906